MDRRTYVVRTRAEAPIERVWDLLVDATGWPRWTRIPRATYEREGEPAPHGVGAIRRMGAGRMVSREEVVAYDAPHHFAYVLHSGLPLRGYRADVHLAADGSGTTIEWSGGFDSNSRIAGTFWCAVLRYVLIGPIARALARTAARQ
ncbi:MAG: SRPBCC family protein [Actinomycetes bacterium]